MKTICLCQARITSKRLPRKVLKPIYKDFNALDLIYLRLGRSRLIDELKYVIPDSDSNIELRKYLEANNYNFSTGDENDLINRYLNAVQSHRDCLIVRVTSDCPLVDPQIVDKAISIYRDLELDYVATYAPAKNSKYCNGSDVEVFSKKLLERIEHNFPSGKDKEHVTFPLWDGRLPNLKTLLMSPEDGEDFSTVRITLDYKSDLTVLSRLLEYANDIHASLAELVKLYKKHGLGKINSDIAYDQGWKQ